MTGIKWKPRYEALLVEHERAIEELRLASDSLKTALAMIDNLNKQVGRAKLEGARGLAEFMLADGQ